MILIQGVVMFILISHSGIIDSMGILFSSPLRVIRAATLRSPVLRAFTRLHAAVTTHLV